jgi:hypothetical protein
LQQNPISLDTSTTFKDALVRLMWRYGDASHRVLVLAAWLGVSANVIVAQRRPNCFAPQYPTSPLLVRRAVTPDSALLRAARGAFFVRVRVDRPRFHPGPARLTLVGTGASQTVRTDSLGEALLVPRFLTRQRLRVQRMSFGPVSDTISPRRGFVDTVEVILLAAETCLERITTG